MLATGAGSTVGVDLKVVVLDRDAFDLINDRRDFNAGERGLTAACGIKRREANEAVDAALGAEKPVGVFARSLEGG